MAAMTIWRGKDPLILASQSRARQMLLANAGISFEAIPADIDERAVQKASGLSAPGEIATLLAARRRCLSRRKSPAGMSSAPIRHWRSATGFSASPPAARRPPSNCACSPANAMNCIRPLRLRATARYCWPMSALPA